MPKLGRKRARDPTDSSTTTTPLRERSSSPCPPPKRVKPSTSTPIASSRKHALQATLPTPPTTPQSAHSQARSLLRISNTAAFVGREAERSTILRFLEPFENGKADGPSCLFISGGPGSGKTALLERLLQEEASRCPNLKTLLFNCMGLSDIQLPSLLCLVMKEISSSEKAFDAQDFNPFMERKEKKCVLVLDEVDQLCSKASLFSDLVEMSQTYRQYLRIIGIANTHTLNVNTKSSCSETLHFPPYTALELNSIIVSRIRSLSDDHPSFFPPSTLLLVSRKVASMSGDVRCLLSILSRAVDFSTSTKHPSVTPAHALQALQKDRSNVSSNSCVQIIRGLGLQGRLILCTLLLAIRRTSAGLPLAFSASPDKRVSKTNQANLSQVSLHSYYTSLLRPSPITPLSRVDFSDVLSALEVNGLVLISLSQPRGAKGRSFVSLASGTQEAELLRGLFGEDSNKHDEVKEIWDLESSRITKRAQLSAEAPCDVFTEASQT